MRCSILFLDDYMYWQALTLLLSVLTVSLLAGWWLQGGSSFENPPSYYDPGLSLPKAAEQSEKPLLVEFYQDSCASCRTLTPALHQVYEQRFKAKATLVMVNVDRPENEMFLTLFGVKTLPALFVFEPKRMKKTPIVLAPNTTVSTLTNQLAQAL
jgi:thiol-disulfide isomerase/thioredoxin